MLKRRTPYTILIRLGFSSTQPPMEIKFLTFNLTYDIITHRLKEMINYQAPSGRSVLLVKQSSCTVALVVYHIGFAITTS